MKKLVLIAAVALVLCVGLNASLYTVAKRSKHWWCASVRRSAWSVNRDSRSRSR